MSVSYRESELNRILHQIDKHTNLLVPYKELGLNPFDLKYPERGEFRKIPFSWDPNRDIRSKGVYNITHGYIVVKDKVPTEKNNIITLEKEGMLSFGINIFTHEVAHCLHFPRPGTPLHNNNCFPEVEIAEAHAYRVSTAPIDIAPQPDFADWLPTVLDSKGEVLYPKACSERALEAIRIIDSMMALGVHQQEIARQIMIYGFWDKEKKKYSDLEYSLEMMAAAKKIPMRMTDAYMQRHWYKVSQDRQIAKNIASDVLAEAA